METTDNIEIYIAYPDKPSKRHLYCGLADVEKYGKVNELPNTRSTTCTNCVKTYNSEKGLDSHIKHINSKRHQLFLKLYR